MHARRLIAAGAIASLLTACSAAQGGGGTSLPPLGAPASPAQSAPAGAKRTARLEVALRVPRKRTHAHYISPSTQSIKIVESGTTLGTFDTTPTTKGCVQQNGTTVCTYAMLAIPGKKSFSITTYDATGAGGSPLSTATVAKTIVANKANSLSLTLNGIPSTITLALDVINPTQGTPATLHLTVNATDADGNTIVGPGGYAHAITIADSDKSGATQLGTTTVTSPSGNVVTVAYNGSAVAATFTASAAGVQNATASLQSVKPHSQYTGGVWAAIPAYGAIPYYNASAAAGLGLNSATLTTATAVAVDDTGRVIAGDAGGNIEVWPISASGTTVPAQSITGAGNVTALAWDAKNGRIIFASAGSSSFGVVNANASGAASGNATYYSAPSYPLATTISGLAVDPNDGTLYVANATPTDSGGGSGSCPLSGGSDSCVNVLKFALQGNGTYSFQGFVDLQDCTGYTWSNLGQIVFDPSHANGDGSLGTLWVADLSPGNDVVFGFGTTTSGCNIANSYSFYGDGANLAQPATLAWDGGDGLWVGDQATTFLQHWTNLYSSPAVASGGSYYLGTGDGGKSPTSIASFSVYVPPAAKRR
jgi:hypothetical protein